MASKRRLRRKSCENKVQYNSVQKALTTLHFLRKLGKYTGKFDVYSCKFCSNHYKEIKNG